MFVGSPLCPEAFTNACDWQKNKDRIQGREVCWELESGHFLCDNLRLMLLNSYWALPPEFWLQQVWSGAWAFAFLTSSQVLLLLLILRPHLSFEAKRWAGSSPGRRMEAGTPGGMCPVLPVYFWPLLPKYLLLGCPFIARGQCHVVSSNREAICHICSLFRKRKFPPLL